MEPHAAVAAWDDDRQPHDLGLDPEPVLGARRAGQDVRRAARADPGRRPPSRRRLRQQDLREARAARRRARARRRPARAAGLVGRRSVPDGAPLRRARPRARRLPPRRHARRRGMPTRTTTSAPTRTSARASSRRVPTRRPGPIASRHVQARRARRLHQHDAGRRVPWLRRSAARWALESLFDVAADRLGRDPVELRRQNLLGHGEEFAPGDTPIDGKLEESLGRAAEAIGWTQAVAADRGRGVAAMLKASIAPSVSEAIVRLHADGSVTVLASAVEMGQGTRTVLAQIAAEVLSVPLARVTVVPARHRHHAVRPDDQLQPLDRDDRARRAGGRGGRARAAAGRGRRRRSASIRAELALDDGAIVGAGAAAPVPGRARAPLRDGRRRADRPRRRGARAHGRAARRQHAVLGDGRGRGRGERGRGDGRGARRALRLGRRRRTRDQSAAPARARTRGRGPGPRPHAASRRCSTRTATS